MAQQKPKVLVAMSGGVDSSVVAALLVRSKKYDVTGAYMLNYDPASAEATAGKQTTGKAASRAIAQSATACWLPDYRDALRVAAHLGIPLIKLDFTKEYQEKVLNYMFREYEAGRTPNPDVLCNTFIKFGSWLEWAKEHGFDFLATGHYAITSQKTKDKKSKVRLMQAKDDNKDQTYFLHQLNQEQLRRTMFPIGNYTKPQVRKLAEKFDLPTAKKAESMGICFVGEVPMKEFLEQRIPPKPGAIVMTNGTVVGQHDGLSFYTIGQRHIHTQAKNEKTQSNEPLYVVGKRLATNELVVGFEDDPLLYSKEVALANIYWTASEPTLPLTCDVRLRHRQKLQKATVIATDDGIAVMFKKPERAVTPGQFAVFYKKGECLGGGVVA